MQAMLEESQLQDLMFIHGSAQDNLRLRLLADDRNSFTELQTVNL